MQLTRVSQAPTVNVLRFSAHQQHTLDSSNPIVQLNYNGVAPPCPKLFFQLDTSGSGGLTILAVAANAAAKMPWDISIHDKSGTYVCGSGQNTGGARQDLTQGSLMRLGDFQVVVEGGKPKKKLPVVKVTQTSSAGSTNFAYTVQQQ